MNLTAAVTITVRGTGQVDPTTGLPTITPTVEYDGVRCAFTILSAAQHEQHWGNASVDSLYRKTFANLVLPTWLPNLPESGQTLGQYIFTVGALGDWQAEAVKVLPEWQTVLVSQKSNN